MYHRFLLLGAATVAGIIGPEADTAGCTAGPEGGAATATDPEDGVVAGAAELAAELFPEFNLPLQPLQVGAHLRCNLVAQLAVLLQGLVDNAFELRRQIRIQPHRSSRRAV